MSRKRSSTKRSPPSVTFFADRNLGTDFVRRLREAGFKIEAHADHFPSAEEDDADWIAEVTRRRWIILTFDKNISRNSREIDALMHGGGRAYVPKGRMLPSDFADLIIRTETRILRHVRNQRKQKSGPYMAKIRPDDRDINKPGHVEKWIEREEWEKRIKTRTGRR